MVQQSMTLPQEAGAAETHNDVGESQRHCPECHYMAART